MIQDCGCDVAAGIYQAGCRKIHDPLSECPIAYHAILAEEWMLKHTALNPEWCRRWLLRLLIWVEEEAQHPSHGGRPLAEVLKMTRAHSSGSERWLEGQRILVPESRPKTPEELRGYRIGRSRERDATGKRKLLWWYAIPPEPEESVGRLNL